MPYIKREDYARAARLPISAGELNYAITFKIIDHLETDSSLLDFYVQALKLCHSYINRRGENYTVMNEVIGVITCAALEMLRRCGDTPAVGRTAETLADVANRIYAGTLAPYEDGKIHENGDVYPKELVV